MEPSERPTEPSDRPMELAEREAGASGAEAVRVVFVCLGNICRSPTAEAIMRGHLEASDLGRLVEIDSAGTGAWHVGEPPDDRARAEATRRGIDLRGRARQFHAGDFHHFDLVVAMDRTNRSDLLDLATSPDHGSKVRLLREFDPEAGDGSDLDVPDPYFGGSNGFAEVFDIVDRACRGLLEHLRDEHLDRR
jgi:protein-tyrosine phosphatase